MLSARARAAAPSIVFFDETDCLAARYEAGEAISFHFVWHPYVHAMVTNRVLKNR